MISLQTLALALEAPTWLIAVASFTGGLGIAVHLTLWFTVFQQQVPERAQSRVSTRSDPRPHPCRDGVGGAVSDAIGVTETLWIALLVMWASWAAILTLPSVWAIRRPGSVSTVRAA